MYIPVQQNATSPPLLINLIPLSSPSNLKNIRSLNLNFIHIFLLLSRILSFLPYSHFLILQLIFFILIIIVFFLSCLFIYYHYLILYFLGFFLVRFNLIVSLLTSLVFYWKISSISSILLFHFFYYSILTHACFVFCFNLTSSFNFIHFLKLISSSKLFFVVFQSKLLTTFPPSWYKACTSGLNPNPTSGVHFHSEFTPQV